MEVANETEEKVAKVLLKILVVLSTILAIPVSIAVAPFVFAWLFIRFVYRTLRTIMFLGTK